MKKILLYGVPEPQADRYQNIAANEDIAMYTIGDEELDQTIEKLFETQDDLNNKADAFASPYMLMQEIEVPELLKLVRLFKQNDLEFEGIKVMKTPTNSSWTLRALLEEAQRENEVARKTVVLRELIKSCNGLDLSKMEAKEQHAFKETLMNAYLLLQSGQYTGEALDEAIGALTQALRSCRKLYN
jgi:hypothetical protein